MVNTHFSKYGRFSTVDCVSLYAMMAFDQVKTYMSLLSYPTLKLGFSKPNLFFNLEKAVAVESRLVDAECHQFLDQLEYIMQNGYPSFKNPKITQTTQYNNNFFIFSSEQTISKYYENINTYFTNSVTETLKKTTYYIIDAPHSEQRTKYLKKIAELLVTIKPLSDNEDTVFDIQKNLVKKQRKVFRKLIESIHRSKQIEENSITNEDIFTNKYFRILDRTFEDENSIKSNINTCLTIIQKDTQIQSIFNNYYNIKNLELIFLSVEKDKTINTIKFLENKMKCYLHSQMELKECFDISYSYSDLIEVQINLHTIVVHISKICNEKQINLIQQKIQQNYNIIMKNFKSMLLQSTNLNFDDVIQYLEIAYKYKALISYEELSEWYKSTMESIETQMANYLNLETIFEKPPEKNSILKKYFTFIKNPIHKNFKTETISKMVNDLLNRIYHIIQHSKKMICTKNLVNIPNIFDFMTQLSNLDFPLLQSEVKNIIDEINKFITELNRKVLDINNINPFENIKNYECKMMQLLPLWNQLLFLKEENNFMFYETFKCFKSNLNIKFSEVYEYMIHNPKHAFEYFEIWNKFGDTFHELTENLVNFCFKKLQSMQELSESSKSDMIWLKIVMKVDYKKFLLIRNNIYEKMEDKINNSKQINNFKIMHKINRSFNEINLKTDNHHYQKFNDLISQHITQIFEDKCKEWNDDKHWNTEQKDLLLENIISTIKLLENINLNFGAINISLIDLKKIIILRLQKLASKCCWNITSHNKEEYYKMFLFIKSFGKKEILNLIQDDYEIIMRKLIDSCCEIYRTFMKADFLPIQSNFELAIEFQNLDPIIAQNCKDIFNKTILRIENAIDEIVTIIEEKIENYMNHISNAKLVGNSLPNAYVVLKNINKLISLTWIDKYIPCFVQSRIEQIVDSLSSCITLIDHQIRYIYWRKIEISSDEITFLIQNLQSFAIIFTVNAELNEKYNSTINYCSNRIGNFIEEVNSFVNTKELTINFNLQYYWTKLDSIYKIILELDKKQEFDKIKIALINCIDLRCKFLVQSCGNNQQNFENIFDELHNLIDWFNGKYKIYYDKALVVVKSDIEDLVYAFNFELENNEFKKAENTFKQIQMKKISLNRFVDENFYDSFGIKIHSPIAIYQGKKEIIDTIKSLLESQHFVLVKLYTEFLGFDRKVYCLTQSYISRKIRDFHNSIIAFDPVSDKFYCKKDLFTLIIPQIHLFIDFWNEVAKIVNWKTILHSISHLKDSLTLIKKQVQNENDVVRALKIIEREESEITSIRNLG